MKPGSPFRIKKRPISKPGHRLRVLLAEDTEANAILVKTRLELQGHHITTACNGRQAVTAFQDQDFDIILMDIQMPEMDGLEATACIRAREIATGAHIPIVALTASLMGDEIKKFLSAGMDSVVAKPIDFKELASVMAELVPQKGGLPGNGVAGDFPRGEDLPSLDGVDVKSGIRRWQKPEVYFKALTRFSDEYENFSARLSFVIEEQDTEQADQMTHRLKGAAGNLSVPKVADLAGIIHSALKKKDMQAVRKHLPLLEKKLHTALDSIRQWGKKQKTEIPLTDFHGPEARKFMKKIMAAFDRYDPRVIEPLIKELEKYIPENQLKSIVRYADALDFRHARDELIKLTALPNPGGKG
nr:response regulator [Desulfobacula sp.]